ncbi:MAG: hypothetical protein COU08_03360 [Candidatus Harrisonbacteria bacterium CG10_big_fil_rev_8_21_14_0_10_42_17]|uniref:DUF4015 domain-containing protein n=1 Tax=Candidatus Harrisonbacteria bacterium CG10_big_fil_rev_8_21_14_0_10_42_17 TaxID=1974584 RepID=A0A2M6WHR2_9BACT|nr:MAG: hypothetical protein COU08_03360 [Candidatus Harrisonbacteria bacterium CG10_big_fil_rev_8_21_14_0_10_42_17]
MTKGIVTILAIGIVLGTGIFFIGKIKNTIEIMEGGGAKAALNEMQKSQLLGEIVGVVVDEKEKAMLEEKPRNIDIEPQKRLQNPPKEIHAIYATSWSAGSEKKIDYFLDLFRTTDLNAIVIDIKDYSGHVSYDTNLDQVENYHAEEIKIPKINTLIKRFHDENVYVIGRVSVFQDQQLILARPDLAVLSTSTGEAWRDRKGLGWADQGSKEVWDYNIAIAREAFERGFDEVNFDYVRFESDGDLDDAFHRFWDGVTWKRNIMKEFFAYTREQLRGFTISADIFGLVPSATGDLGIGQYFEDTLPYFDYVAPMMYPSHYAAGYLGYQNPAEYPYEVVYNSSKDALRRMNIFRTGTTSPEALATANLSELTNQENVVAKLRPWIQDFNLGATYNEEKVRGQINALSDLEKTAPSLVDGYMVWNPSNNYTREAHINE